MYFCGMQESPRSRYVPPANSHTMKQHSHAPELKSQKAFGIHSVLEALQSGQSVEKILLSKDRELHHRVNEIRTIAKEDSIPVQWVPEVKIDRLSKQGNHQGVLAYISPIRYHSLDELVLKAQGTDQAPLLIMLDGVTDVRNFGAIARTAACMGAHGLIIPAKGSASIQADAIKTSAGALMHLPVCRVNNLTDAYYVLKTYGIAGIACTEKAEESVFDMDFQLPSCLIFGAEDKGISSQLVKRVDFLAKIPISGPVASLNVSVAVGMTLTETYRQRQLAG